MKFPRFYNPFRRIRDLEALNRNLNGRIARQRYSNRDLTTAHKSLLDRYNGEKAATIEYFEHVQQAWAQQFAAMAQDLDGASQAIDAFMDEREDFKMSLDAFWDERETLKAGIQLREELGVNLTAELLASETELAEATEALADYNGLAAQAIDVMDRQGAEIDRLKTADIQWADAYSAQADALQEQKDETLEVVSYVKQCETELALAGIAILAGPGNAPQVSVDTEKLLNAMRLGLIVAVPVSIPEAA